MDEDPRDRSSLLDRLPHVADGLTRIERVVLYVLREAQQEFGNRPVPTVTLYGRVVEHVDISQEEFYALLVRMVGARGAEKNEVGQE